MESECQSFHLFFYQLRKNVKGREGKRREGKGRKGKGREGKEREGNE